MSTSFDTLVKLWDVESWQCVKTISSIPKACRTIAFYPETDLLISGGEDSQIRFWNFETAECLKTISAHNAAIWNVKFNPQNNLLASCGMDGELKLWEMSNNSAVDYYPHLLQRNTTFMLAVAFHPNAKRLANGGGTDNNIYLWDYCTRELIRTFEKTECNIIMDLSFHPQGHLLASASKDYTVRIWDVATGECIKILAGHTDLVNCVVYHPDPQRRLLASCSHDETIRLWDTETWECLKVLRPQRVYEDMNITGATGLSPAQLATLKTLGAITQE